MSAGVSPDAALGERHDPEAHLIPLALRAAMKHRVGTEACPPYATDSGKFAGLTVFGTDYDTPDGTCIRDYIHIVDLCDAHVLALQHLMSGGESRAYNLGNGQGYSVQEVIEVAERVSGKPLPASPCQGRSFVARAVQVIRLDWWPMPARFARTGAGHPASGRWSRLWSMLGCGR